MPKDFLCHFHFFCFQKLKIDFGLLKLLIHLDGHLEEKNKKNKKQETPKQFSRILRLWSFGVDTFKERTFWVSLNTRNMFYPTSMKQNTFNILNCTTIEIMSCERSRVVHWYSDESLADCCKIGTKFQRRLFRTLHPGIWSARLFWQ